MTCVVAYIDKPTGKVHLAGDTSVTTGMEVDELPGGKVWRTGEFYMGASGDLRTLQVARYLFEPPEFKEGTDAEAYMVRQFVPAWRDACSQNHLLYRSSGEQQYESGGNLLVVVRQTAFIVGRHFAVFQSPKHYAAIGATDEHAMVALAMADRIGSRLVRTALPHAEATPPFHVKELLEMVLTACAERSNCVFPPYTFIEGEQRAA